MHNGIRYLIGLKSGITYVFLIIFAKIKINLYDPFSLENISTLHNVIILIKSVFNKILNHYYYNIFLEICLYQLPKNNDNK